MKNDEQLRLWRVEWVHRNGYQAPSQLVEAKRRKEVIPFAKAYRLADFPEKWSYHVTDTGKEQKRGKWYDR
jgi:hypothetical protein